MFSTMPHKSKKMKNNVIVLGLLMLFISGTLFGGDGENAVRRFASEQDTTVQSEPAFPVPVKGLFDGRRETATIYSLFIPGSGQTMLGSPYKGFSFTFAVFSSALTSLISHYNFVASNERLDALEFQYKTSTTWQVSNSLYSSMIEAHSKMNKYKKTRDTFAAVSAVVWALNVADVVFNTTDEGESAFSSVHFDVTPVFLAGGVIDHQQRLLVSVPLD